MKKGCLIVEGDHVALKTRFVPTQFIRFESATLETEDISQQALFELIQDFKARVRHQGRAFYRLQLNIRGDEMISPQVLEQLKVLSTEYEENERHFVLIDEWDIRYIDIRQKSIIQEFPAELLEQDDVYERAVKDLYMN